MTPTEALTQCEFYLVEDYLVIAAPDRNVAQTLSLCLGKDRLSAYARQFPQVVGWAIYVDGQPFLPPTTI